MSKNKKSIKIFLSFMLSILMVVTTILGSSIVANAAPVSGQAIVNEAMNHLGKPYVYGKDGPDSFDCSGLTSYVYKKVANIDIGRTTFDQINAGREVSRDELQPGDLVFPHDEHVMIYIGNGQVIQAPQTGDVVKISPIWKFWRARRIIETPIRSSLENLLFNANLYHDKYKDLRDTFGHDVNQFSNHFYSNGIKEGRGASEVFDVRYYLSHNKDLINAFGANNYQAAYNHFITSGYKESRDLSPVFNMETYIKNNPDVANTYGADHEGIMKHFLTNGMKEGRNASANFNLEMYKFNYEDLRNAFGNDNQAYYDHYLTGGINEGRIANDIVFKTNTANLIFDAKFYADKYPDLKKTFGYNKVQLAKHFISDGIKEGRSASEVFDVRYYLSKSPDLIAAFGKDNYQAAYDHFLSDGYKENRKLSPVFDMAYYIKNNPDVANVYGNDHNGVINHFLVSGMKEGRIGSEDFNIKVYKKNYKDLEKAFGGDNKAYFDHYLQCGIAEGRIAK